MGELAGVLPVDKPEGPTSHDVVAAARRALRMRRIGHTGTLDPFASGLLLLCTGRATRLARYLGGLDKKYAARMRLGAVTDTDDGTGRIVREYDHWDRTTVADLRCAFDELTGDIEQTPPAYSAKKVGGERAYRLARSGHVPELTPVPVHVEEIHISRFEPPEVDFEITCGSGTYIRSIARDAGTTLGVGGHLTALRRVAVGDFQVGDAVPMNRLEDEAAVSAAWVEPLQALRHLPCILLSADQARLVSNGGTVQAGVETTVAGPVALAAAGRLLAVAELRDGRWQPRTVVA